MLNAEVAAKKGIRSLLERSWMMEKFRFLLFHRQRTADGEKKEESLRRQDIESLSPSLSLRSTGIHQEIVVVVDVVVGNLARYQCRCARVRRHVMTCARVHVYIYYIHVRARAYLTAVFGKGSTPSQRLFKLLNFKLSLTYAN